MTATMLTRNESLAALILSAIIVADIAIVAVLQPALQHAQVFSVALVIDVLLFVGGGLWFLRRRHETLGQFVEWKRVARATALVFVLAVLGLRLSGADVSGWLLLPVAAVEAVIAFVVARTLWSGWREAQDVAVWPRLETALSDALGARLASAAVGELRILVSAARSLTRRPVQHVSGYTASRSSSWGALVVGLCFATLMEMVAVHMLVSKYVTTGQSVVHALLFLLHAYGLAWLIGDWRVMRETAHRIDGDTFEVELGLRWRASVAVDNLAAVDLGEVEQPNSLLGEKRPDHVAAISPMETPNVTLHLHEPTSVATYFGITKEATELQLYVDEPAALAAEPKEWAGLEPADVLTTPTV